MKRKLIFFLIVAVCHLIGISRAQTLSPVVISASGGFSSATNVSLSYTIAEMTMVQTFSSSGNFLTQGFQQPEGILTSVPESPIISGNLLIYPNPTNGNFTVSFVSNDQSETVIRLYDMTGQVVLTKNVSPCNGRNTAKFDISNFSQGIYLLALPLENEKGEKKISYHKINLIY